MSSKEEFWQDVANQLDWLTIKKEMSYLFGAWVMIPDGDEKKRLGGSLKSLERARRNIEARGERLSPRQRANYAILRIRYGRYVQDES